MSGLTTSKAPAIELAKRILSEPMEAEMPPSEIFTLTHGPMTGGEPNPAVDEWIKAFLARVHALCIVKGIELTASGDINWMCLALELARYYEPRDRREPRIRFKRKRGAKPKHNTWEGGQARRELAALVDSIRASKSDLSVAAIAKSLAQTKAGQRRLPDRFKGRKWETLRKHIERAVDEAERERKLQATISELFKAPGLLRTYSPFSPGADFVDKLPGWSGSGLNIRPNRTPPRSG